MQIKVSNYSNESYSSLPRESSPQAYALESRF